eukprot:6724123-Heterocapsa_arctica.AAC.1
MCATPTLKAGHSDRSTALPVGPQNLRWQFGGPGTAVGLQLTSRCDRATWVLGLSLPDPL